MELSHPEECVLPQEANLTFPCTPNQGPKPQTLACHRKGLNQAIQLEDTSLHHGNCHGSPTTAVLLLDTPSACALKGEESGEPREKHKGEL